MFNSYQYMGKESGMKVFEAVVIVIVLLVMAVPASTAGAQDTPKKVSVAQKVAGKSSFLETQKAVRETLDSMVDAYTGKNARQFMSGVSEDFAGDDTTLDRKIRRDFGRFADMDMRYTLNNVTPDSGNKKISVSVTFTRSYTDIKTSKRINKTGSTSFIFRMVDGRAKLAAMRGPAMFGVGK